MTKQIARLVAALSLAALLAPVAARAEFGTTNFQLLQGWNFDKDINATSDKKLTTLTVNHFSTFAYGDNFFFVDMQRGKLGGNDTVTAGLYGEWHPRLFLNKLGAPAAGGLIKNYGFAGEVNTGSAFFAYLGGVTADFNIPGFQVAGLSVYYRYDTVDAGPFKKYNSTYQISPWWDVPFKTGPVSWDFSGFVDVTTDDGKLDVMAQPELLVDVGAFAGAPGKFHAGIEWYIHKFTPYLSGKSELVSAPQFMVQWTPFTQFVP
jgi:nucleoside-specific outer membrane channel protein Tsx